MFCPIHARLLAWALFAGSGNSVLAPLLGFLFMNEGCTDGVYGKLST